MKNKFALLILMYSFLISSCASVSNDKNTAIGLEELKSGNTIEAKKIFEVRCQNQDRSACVQLGLLSKNENKKIEALKMFNKSCDLGSTYSCYLAGLEYLEKNELLKAQIYFEKSCGDFTEACVLLGSTHASLGNYNESNKILEGLCENSMAEACALLGQNFVSQNQFEKGLIALTKGCSLKNKNACYAKVAYEFLVGNSEKGHILAKQACSDGVAQSCRIENMFNSLRNNLKTLQKFKNDCEINKKDSCYTLGLYQILHLKTYKKGKTTLEKSCNLGNGLGCAELANFTPYFNKKKSIILFKRACENGAGRSCAVMAEDFSDINLEQSREELLKRGCDLNDGLACVALSKYSYDQNKKLSLYKKACDMEYLEGCYWYTVSTTKEPEMITAIKSMCDKNLSVACQSAAVFEEKNKNLSAAKLFYQKACDLNDIFSCEKVANSSDNQKIRLSEICNYGDFASCAKAGIIYYDETDFKNARILFNKGCALFDRLSCTFLGIISLRENDPASSLNFLKKACDLGSTTACEKISQPVMLSCSPKTQN